MCLSWVSRRTIKRYRQTQAPTFFSVSYPKHHATLITANWGLSSNAFIYQHFFLILFVFFSAETWQDVFLSSPSCFRSFCFLRKQQKINFVSLNVLIALWNFQNFCMIHQVVLRWLFDSWKKWIHRNKIESMNRTRLFWELDSSESWKNTTRVCKTCFKN